MIFIYNKHHLKLSFKLANILMMKVKCTNSQMNTLPSGGQIRNYIIHNPTWSETMINVIWAFFILILIICN